MKTAWRTAKKMSGVTARWHDLRHTVVKRLLESGQMLMVANILGGSPSTMVRLAQRYGHITQKNHRHISAKHLVPRFGDTALCDVTRQDVQEYVAYLTQAGYAPKTVDDIHDVLSAVLRTAVDAPKNSGSSAPR